MIFKINREILNENHNEILLLLEQIENDKEYCQKKIDDLYKFVESKDTYLFGHINNNKLISFLWCYKRVYNNAVRLHISFLAVNNDFQRQGLAKELFNKVIETLKSTDIEFVDLNVSSNNKAAIKLYEKLGFIEESRLLKFRKD